VLIEVHALSGTGSDALIAVPYTPRETGAFAVHRPVLLEWRDGGSIDRKQAMDSFFEGVKEHPQGSKVWREAFKARAE